MCAATAKQMGIGLSSPPFSRPSRTERWFRTDETFGENRTGRTSRTSKGECLWMGIEVGNQAFLSR